jgi:Abhydrolase family
MSSDRNLSPRQMFIQLAKEHTPLCACNATGPEEFAAWKADALPKVLDCLGDPSPKVPLNPEFVLTWEDGNLIKEKWIIDVGPHISAALFINRHKGMADDEKRPAILCCHGHSNGRTGKNPVMGNVTDDNVEKQIKDYNYDYGHQMAEAGYVTFAIDCMGFGERCDENKPHLSKAAGQRDWCNLLYLVSTMLGTTSLGMNCAHGSAAIDFICEQAYVDPDKFGVMGLSGGGTMATWMSLYDDRVKATEIICYSDLFEEFLYKHNNGCGMQVAPGLFKLVDLPDLQGLIAPRPLLIDIGAMDACFLIESSMACFKKVEAIYSAANARDNLDLDLFPSGHAWGANKSTDFFGKHLGKSW